MDVHQSFEAAAAKKSSSKLLARNKFASDNATVCSSVVSKSSPAAAIHYSLTKENLSPCARTPSKIRPPLQSNSVTGNLPESFPDGITSNGSFSAICLASGEPSFDDGGVTGFGNIDSEIESIEKEISRLTLRLEYLRLEKVKRISAKSAAALRRGRFVPAKFMDPPLPPSTGKINPRKLDESKSAKQKAPVGRQAISLGPAEIYSATKLRKPANRQEFTPVNRSQSRRKSCFWKIQEADELKVSPKLGVTTVRGSNNRSVKEDEFISSIQPKELFEDGDKSVTAKKPMRCGRVVSSRYMCSNGGQAHGDSAAPKGSRKRSLPDSDKESKTFDRKRVSKQSEAFE